MSHAGDHRVAGVCLCVFVYVWKGRQEGIRANVLSREWGKGNRGRRQEAGSWKRKLHPLSLHNTVTIATASGEGSQ